MRRILLIGGLGYIGSVTCASLPAEDECVIIDNLSNSHISTLHVLEEMRGKKIPFYQSDLDLNVLREVFYTHKIDVVINLAGKKSVVDSISSPLEYYRCNFVSCLELVEMMLKYRVNNLVFSSSATVYGDASPSYTEETLTGHGITNPYGRTKYFIEEMLKDTCKAQPSFNCTLLRYFNPMGAYRQGEDMLGENPSTPGGNLMPIMLRKLQSGETLQIFSGDEDGELIRDFIHVVDLARGHVVAMGKMDGLKIYNLGTGNGVSVLDLVRTFNEVNEVDLKYEFAPRREGDLSISIGDTYKAREELGWKCEKEVQDMCRDSYDYFLKQKS